MSIQKPSHRKCQLGGVKWIALFALFVCVNCATTAPGHHVDRGNAVRLVNVAFAGYRNFLVVGSMKCPSPLARDIAVNNVIPNRVWSAHI